MARANNGRSLFNEATRVQMPALVLLTRLGYILMEFSISVKQAAIPQISRVYAAFKLDVEERDVATEDLLSDMLKYAKFYQILRVGNTTIAVRNSCI